MVHEWAGRLPDPYWTRPNFDYLKELIRKAEEYDRLTNQPHCEDPEKVKVMERIEQRLTDIEWRLNDRTD
jgi:hypothetical protein